MIFLMAIPNWNELKWYHYLAIGDVVVILALLLYFATRSRSKMPGIALGILGGVGVGAALGAAAIIAMIALGVRMDQEYYANMAAPATEENAPPGIRGGGRGGPGTRGGGGGGAAKAQLASLIAKLDLLTHKPLELKLDAEQKKKLHKSLEKLDAEEALSDETARAKLEELQQILTDDQRKTLDSAGFRFPGQGGGGRGGGRGGRGGPPQEPPPNPFSEGENNRRLKSLLGESK